MERSRQYEEGRRAFFQGYNETDVVKFYPEKSPAAVEWLEGLKDAKKETGQ